MSEPWAYTLDCREKRWAVVPEGKNTWKISSIRIDAIDPSHFRNPLFTYLFGDPSTIRWNGTTSSFQPKADWLPRPVWFVIALICHKVDPLGTGSKLATKILEADPGDDTDTLIACDWLEEKGIQGVANIEVFYKDIRGTQQEYPDWIVEKSIQKSMPFDVKESLWDLQVSGSIASWARRFIDTRCVGCGGLKSGSDRLISPDVHFFGLLNPDASESETLAASGPRSDLLAHPRLDILAVTCMICGHKSHTSLPEVIIPELISCPRTS